MNHIYRIVFNQALGAWMAVSELAKGKQKKASKNSKPLTVALLATLITGVGVAQTALAWDTAMGINRRSDGIYTVGPDNWECSPGEIIFNPNNNAPGVCGDTSDYTVVIGYGATSDRKNSVVLGSYARTTGEGDANQEIAIGSHALASGQQATVLGSNSASSAQSVAIGSDVFAQGKSSIAIGNDDIVSDKWKDTLPAETITSIFSQLYQGANGITPMDQNYFNTHYTGNNSVYSPTYAKGLGSIAIGSRTVAAGDVSTALGSLSFALAEKSTAVGIRSFVSTDAVGGTAIGEKSRVFAKESVAIGNQTEASDSGAMAYGYKAVAAGQGSIAIGSEVAASAAFDVSRSAKLVDSYKKLSESHGTSADFKTFESDLTTAVVGDDLSNPSPLPLERTGKTYMTIGSEEIKKTDTYQADGQPDTKSKNAIAIGSSSFAVKRNSLAMGYGALADADNSFAVGSYSYVNSKGVDSIALGVASYAEGADALAMGTFTKAKAQGSMAIGYKASADMENSIALGVNSLTDYGKDNLDKPGWVPEGAISIPTSGKTGVVSVGSHGAERRIVNVASGYLDTDAVNVAQLRSLDEKFKTQLAGISSGGGLQYLSVDKSSPTSEAGKLAANLVKRDNYEQYVKLKAQALAFEARKELNGEKFNAAALKTITDKVAELGALYGNAVSNTATSLKAAEQKLKAAGKDPTQYQSILAEIDKAKDADLARPLTGTDSLSKEQAEAAKQGNNYLNDGAHGDDSIAIGWKASTDAKASHAVAIGFESTAKDANSVALGAQASTSAAVATSSASVPVTGSATPFTFEGFAGASPVGVLSVGAQGKERQIQHVAAGQVTATSTDAINGSQLYSLASKVANLKSVTVKGTEKEIKVNPASQGDGSTQYTVSLDDAVKTKLTKLDSVPDNLNDALGKKADKQDVDKQIKEATAEAAKHTEVEQGDGITVTPGTAPSGGKKYTVALADALKKKLDNVPENVNDALGKKADKNAGNLTADDVNAWKNKLGVSNLDLSYKANDKGGGTTTLSNGLNFKDGTNTTATAETGGVVKFDVKADLTGMTSIAGTSGQGKLSFADGSVVNVVGAKNIKLNAAQGTITGLTNTTWDAAKIVSGRAATEDQLKIVQEAANHAAGAAGNALQSFTVTANDGNFVVTKDQTAFDVKAVANSGITTNIVGGSHQIDIGFDPSQMDDNAKSALAKQLSLHYKGSGGAAKEGGDVVLTSGLDFQNGTNTEAVADANGVIKYNLSKDLKDLSSVSIKDGPSLKADGIDAGNKALKNVASGLVDDKGATVELNKASGDTLKNAANIGDLQKAINSVNTTIENTKTEIQNSGFEVATGKLGQDGKVDADSALGTLKHNNKLVLAAGQNAEVTGATDGNGTFSYTINVKGIPMTYVDSQGKPLVQVNGDFYHLNDKGAVDLASKGTPAGVKVVKDTKTLNNGKVEDTDLSTMEVADGKVAAGSKQAVNGSQLHSTADSIAKLLGGGATVNNQGELEKPAYQLKDADGKDKVYNNVGEALAGLQSQVSKAGQSGNIFSNDSNLKVTKDAKDSSGKLGTELSLSKDPAFNTVKVGGVQLADKQGALSLSSANGQPVRVTGVADGVADTDAVNMRQFKKVSQGMVSAQKEMRRGVAGAMAAAGLQQASMPGHTTVSLGSAIYHGETATAIGISTLSDSGKWGLRASGTLSNGGDTGVSASVSYTW